MRSSRKGRQGTVKLASRTSAVGSAARPGGAAPASMSDPAQDGAAGEAGREAEPSRVSLYDEVTSRIVGELEAGRLPWVKPWGKVGGTAPGLPCNAATGRTYSGVNILLLWGSVIEHGYATQGWLTFRQAQKAGGQVRRGERGTTVVFADKFTPKAEQERAAREGDAPGAVPFLKRFTVFNVDQCEGLEALAADPAPLPERQIIPHVEALIAATRADFLINTTRRSYHLQMRASSRAYLSQVAWRYPQAPNLAPTVPFKPVVLVSPPAPPAPVTLNLSYRIKGEARWRPARVYDDGARTYVEFGPAIALSDLPPLYGLGADGKTSELINYRLEGRRLVVDRLFDRAELRFGLKRWERRVRIERTAPAREAGQ